MNTLKLKFLGADTWITEHSDVHLSPAMHAWIIEDIFSKCSFAPGDRVMVALRDDFFDFDSLVYIDLWYGHEVNVVTGQTVT